MLLFLIEHCFELPEPPDHGLERLDRLSDKSWFLVVRDEQRTLTEELNHVSRRKQEKVGNRFLHQQGT
jgi:hypothetical protein